MTTERLTLEAKPRAAGLKGPSRRVRAQGLIPGVVYGGNSDARAVSVEPKALESVLRTEFGFNNVFSVKIEGESAAHLCMLKERQIDPVRRAITHIDLLVVDPDREVEVRVPVKTEGRSAGERAGGRMQIVARDVLVRCKVKDIPSAIVHDVTNANLGDSIYIDQFTPPAGVSFVYRNRFPVLLVARKRGATADDEK